MTIPKSELPKPYAEAKGFECIDGPCPHNDYRTTQMASTSAHWPFIEVTTAHTCKKCGNFWRDTSTRLPK